MNSCVGINLYRGEINLRIRQTPPEVVHEILSWNSTLIYRSYSKVQ